MSQDLLDKIIRIRAIGDLIGYIIGAALLVYFVGWLIFHIIKEKKKNA